jgi:multiple sugar transport system ATP-binding protein
MASIELGKVSKAYANGAYGVRDVDLSIADGEFVIFLGPSGCGKSTTLRLIAGLESVTSGALRIGGVDVTGVPPRHRNIAVVFQSYALYPHMSVRDNMAFGLKMRHAPAVDIARKVDEAAGLLGLSAYLDRKPAALSGGQRQRVALGRAIVRDPQAFLLDEPLSNLDAQLRAEMRLELIKLHRRLGRTIVHVTHDQVEAMTMGDRIVIMRDGRVIQVGRPLEVYADPADTFVASFLATPPMNLLSGRVEAAGDGVVVHVADTTIAAPSRCVPAYAPWAGRSVIVGIRPEDLHEAPSDPSFRPLEVEIVAIEALGVENIVIGQTVGGESREISARLSRRWSASIGARVTLWVDPQPIHLFDPETTRLIPRPPIG